MKLTARWWTAIIQFFDIITLQPPVHEQQLSPALEGIRPTRPHVSKQDEVQTGTSLLDKGPRFDPPQSGVEGFKCDYSHMVDWEECSTSDNRGCWLRNKVTGKEFNITTDYENLAPNGTVRKYHLVLDRKTLAPDGFNMTHGKVFNDLYPGPWIQACWGDTIEVTVENKLQYNGTTVHWHGIRQHNTMDMDGVNAVTQCAIAPGDSYTYRFKAKQYGTSWYHSHYSLQYGDGALGPMTIYGPSSASYTDAIEPILMSDWSHRSAFEDFYVDIGAAPYPGGQKSTPPPKMTSIVINGKGYENSCNAEQVLEGKCEGAPPLYEMIFEKGKRYLLRLINTSVDTTFVFSIDNHDLEIMTTDFVPIHPYKNTSVMVGIGQRYHVVVEAKPKPNPGPGAAENDENFWIRMTVAKQCGSFNEKPDERRGVLRYDPTSKGIPKSTRNIFSEKCSDETYTSLRPILPWNIGNPINDERGSFLEAGLTIPPTNGSVLPHGNFARWSLGEHPMWLDFNNPTIMSLNKTVDQWNPEHVIIPAQYPADAWVYMIITADPSPFRPRFRQWIPLAHPIHLHGHDFALLEQSDHPYWERMVNMKFDNPPRRDTALLPRGGYLIIAFKADNPGIWLMHCHIAMHASSGLAVQIIERQEDLQRNWNGKKLEEVGRGCDKFNSWYSSKRNWWNWDEFQDDSGI